MDDEKFITTSHDVFPRGGWSIRMGGVIGKCKPKFDPNTLKPFDKVLVRCDRNSEWECDFFSRIKKEDIDLKCVCIGGCFERCIPYNDDTKYLASTASEAPEFYRYWDK